MHAFKICSWIITIGNLVIFFLPPMLSWSKCKMEIGCIILDVLTYVRCATRVTHIHSEFHTDLYICYCRLPDVVFGRILVKVKCFYSWCMKQLLKIAVGFLWGHLYCLRWLLPTRNIGWCWLWIQHHLLFWSIIILFHLWIIWIVLRDLSNLFCITILYKWIHCNSSSVWARWFRVLSKYNNDACIPCLKKTREFH